MQNQTKIPDDNLSAKTFLALPLHERITKKDDDPEVVY